MKYKFLLLLLIALQITGCQKNQKTETPKLENGSKEINRNGYSIVYDSDFRLDESGRNGVDFYLFMPMNHQNDFGENINLMIQNLETLKYDLDQFVALSENQIKASGKLIESVRKKSGEQEFHMIIFEGNFNGLDLKFLQYDFVKDDKAYVLTFSAKRNDFENNLKKAEKVMNSFTLQ